MRLLVTLLLLGTLLLEAKSYIRDYTYNASENDSKVSARKAALRQIQRLLIEEVGISVRSDFVKNEQLKDGAFSKTIQSRYKSFAQAITKTKILEQKWNGETFYLKVAIDINPDDVAKTIDAIQNPAAQPLSYKEQCRNRSAAMKKMLNDLSTQKNREAIITEAIKHPFDTQCNDWHYGIIQKFLRYEIFSAAYKEFLLKTLQKIDYPASDNRALSILAYLRFDDGITQQEWPVVFTALKKTTQYKLYRMMNVTFSRQNSDTHAFLDDFIEEAINGKVGLPKPLHPSYIIYNALNIIQEQDEKLFYSYYEKLQKHLLPKHAKEIYEKTFSSYLKTPTQAKRQLMAAYLNKQQASSALADDLLYLVERIEREFDTRKVFKKDLPYLLKEITPIIQKSFASKASEHEKERRILFLLKHHIPSNMIPTPQLAAKMLFDTDYETQVRHAHYLALMGKSSQAAEKSILKRLKRLPRDTFRAATQMEHHLIDTLGNIQSNNPKAIQLLIQALASKRYDTPKHAQEALIKLGSHTSKALIAAYAKQEDYVKIKIINILGHAIGSDSTIQPFLKSIKTTNSWINDAIEDALQDS